MTSPTSTASIPTGGTLTLENVIKVFPGRDGGASVYAVNNVSIKIERGEFVTLLGPSGCGKTTTLRMIAGFEFPNSGRIMLGGQDITYQAPNKRDMAMVFQSYALFPHMTVYDNIAYGLRIQKVSAAEIKQRVERILEQTGLAGLGKRRPNELSGGQQQRVALARCLIIEPQVLLFDEPLSNLDAKLRVQMRNEIHSLQRKLNITSVYVTHDQAEAMALSDRIVVMRGGQIEQIGTPAEIYRYPASRFVADFIGQANFLPAQIKTATEGQAQVEMLGRTLTVKTRQSATAGQTVEAVLRPESVVLRRDASLPQVVIESVMYLGAEVEYTIMLNSTSLIVIQNDPAIEDIFKAGEQVGIDFIPEKVHLLL
ncbi:MAG: ABC transporter ATP-binding protein [Anaerolineae bacterium]